MKITDRFTRFCNKNYQRSNRGLSMNSKILVFGVVNWDTEEDALKLKYTLQNWLERINRFIPNIEKVFLVAGSYSPPEFNPTSCELYQIDFYKSKVYSKQNSYFRLGFMTGIWKTLLDYSNCDILIHCQFRTLLGEDMSENLIKFWDKDEQVMAPFYHAGNGTIQSSEGIMGIDVGFIAMKKRALKLYAVTGLRQSFNPEVNCLNCEEEAYYMFKDSWYNPWPKIKTMKQIDTAWLSAKKPGISPYEITDINYFSNLPFIAIGKHVTKEFYDAWLEKHPI